MRYHENACQPDHQQTVASIRRVAATLGLKSGFIDDARRAATTYVIDCPGLAREVIDDAERRDWCHDRCYLDHDIEPIRDN